jgi:hypothetical protein
MHGIVTDQVGVAFGGCANLAPDLLGMSVTVSDGHTFDADLMQCTDTVVLRKSPKCNVH